MPPRTPIKAPAPPPRVPSLEGRLDRLEAALRELQVRYQRFLNGEDNRPPDELRDRLAAELRELQNVQTHRSVDQFRLGNLEARYNSYREMYQRRVRDQEEGRVRGAPKIAREADHDPASGVVIGGEAPAAGAVEALFQGLANQGAAAAMDLDTFRRYLDRQVAAIRDKTGCREVQFRVLREEGKVKLKARPVTSS